MRTVLLLMGGWFVLSLMTLTAWSLFARTLAGMRLALAPDARHRRRVLWSQVLLLVTSVVVAASASRAQDWHPGALVALLAALALASDAVPVRLGRYRFTAGFVAIVLAMALAGPGPAVLIGVLCATVDAVRERPPRHHLLNNLAAYAAFPVAGALALRTIEGTGDLTLALACLGVAVLVNLFNFALIAGHATLLEGDPLGAAVRTTWVPVLPWEIASATVTAATVYGYLLIGPVVVAAFAVALASLQVMATRIAASTEAAYILKTP